MFGYILVCVRMWLFDLYDFMMACKRVTVGTPAYIMVPKCVVLQIFMGPR